MIEYLPYIVSVVCATIAGFTSYAVARKQTKADMQKLVKQHELDIEKEREKFLMEKEKLEIEHEHQLELIQAQTNHQLGTDIISTLTKEYLRTPAGQAQMRSSGRKNTSR
ncbi:MAG: hypothetical protein EOM03_06795 [Clostridia bacterium]|nr:hypothetical protein [Clostridia bacterium]NCC83819.1 hypothetical protein [Clostridia bacterium]